MPLERYPEAHPDRGTDGLTTRPFPAADVEATTAPPKQGTTADEPAQLVGESLAGGGLRASNERDRHDERDLEELFFQLADQKQVAILARVPLASGLLTGLLLGLTLPPGLPLWMAFLGGFVGIALGKVIWGGLGHNLFNPALLGRAFLLATFPIAMTTWVPGTGDGGFLAIYPSNLALPFMQVSVDAMSSATPASKAERRSRSFRPNRPSP